ncbi:MAG TPA: helix-hairpin-helix domain-containing protein [Gammaproteobacteria bacterium]
MKIKGLIKVLSFAMLTFSAVVAAAGKVNINTADAKALAAALEGVGQSKAEAIVQYRTEHGPFKSVEALVNVKGIGQSVIKSNLEKMTVTAEK